MVRITPSQIEQFRADGFLILERLLSADTTAAGGTIEYARGSHRWGVFPKIRQFHAPDDYREALKDAALAYTAFFKPTGVTAACRCRLADCSGAGPRRRPRGGSSG
jgi:hypothetical protein